MIFFGIAHSKDQSHSWCVWYYVSNLKLRYENNPAFSALLLFLKPKSHPHDFLLLLLEGP